jgi:Oxidoreductase molybdopterin binding domain
VKALLIAVSLTLAAAPALAQSVRITGPGGQSASLASADLAALPRVKATLSAHGETHVYEGPRLIDLLAKVGTPTGSAIRGAEMADAVVVEGSDGYRVALSLAETDPGVRKEAIILADRVDGAPIAAKDGPFRLVVEGDLRPARSVRMVTSVEVVRLPKAP